MKQIELTVLAALMDAPVHGYALATRIAEMTSGRVEVRPGNLYRVLARLEQRGWVTESESGEVDGGDERRRYFDLTASGRRAADAELGMYADILARTRGARERLADG